MKITKSKIRRILREEYLKLLREQSYAQQGARGIALRAHSAYRAAMNNKKAKQGQTASDLTSYGFKPGEKEQLSDIERLNLQTAEEPLSRMSVGAYEAPTWTGSPESEEEFESLSGASAPPSDATFDPGEEEGFGVKEPDYSLAADPLGVEFYEPGNVPMGLKAAEGYKSKAQMRIKPSGEMSRQLSESKFKKSKK